MYVEVSNISQLLQFHDSLLSETDIVRAKAENGQNANKKWLLTVISAL